jgi:phage terminase large subunit-like protein
VGVDLSSTIDLTSVGFICELSEGNYAVLSHSFVPEERIEQKRKSDKVPYDLWVKQGWITATEGAEVDYHQVLGYIEEQYDKFGWYRDEFCYDRALATW